MSGPFMVQKMMVDRVEEASYFISSIPWGESNIDDIFYSHHLEHLIIILSIVIIRDHSEPKLRRSHVSQD